MQQCHGSFILPFTYKNRYIRSKRYNRNVLPCVHHVSTDVTREHHGCIPIQSAPSVCRGSNITQMWSDMILMKLAIKIFTATLTLQLWFRKCRRNRTEASSVFACTCKGSVRFKSVVQGITWAYFWTIPAQMHPCCCTWCYGRPVLESSCVKSNKLYRESSCCIVGSWTCFGFLKTFHFSSKNERWMRYSIKKSQLRSTPWAI